MEIPGFSQITLHERPVFTEFFRKFSPQISEYTFTNLYMWRNLYQFRWKTEKNHLYLLSLQDPTKIIAFPPVGADPKTAVATIKETALQVKMPLELHRVPENMAQIISEAFPGATMVEDRNNWDYVYLRQDLALLPGKNYENERKKLNKFKTRNAWGYFELDAQQISDCLKLQEAWCQLRSCSEDPGLAQEHDAIVDMLHNWSDLLYKGGLLRVDGQIVAFTLGEELTPDEFVCHIEKANPEVVGAYQAINQQFNEHVNARYIYMNREQDIGEPNLRRAKENYHPAKYIKKYIIREIN